MNAKKLASILLVTVFVFVLFGIGSSAEANWPTRPVSVIVPFNPGGDTDFYARLYSKFLETELGQPFPIINVAGAGGTVGATQVSVARNDGYTVLFYHTGNLFVNNMLGTTDLNHNDFAMSCIAVLDDTNVLVAGKDAGFTDAANFLERARANPRGYSVSTTISGFSFFTVVKMQNAGGFLLNAVDVGGAAAMVPAVLGNHTELAANSYGVFKQYIENGDIIALMTTGTQRNPNFPDIPTAIEMGLEGASAERAYFFAFPKGTDPAILHRLANAVKAVQQKPEFAREAREMFSVEPFFVDTSDVQNFMDNMWTDMERYIELVLNP
jgi:tripartite-type tricarboxylate transporter receptor subunit TctC